MIATETPQQRTITVKLGTFRSLADRRTSKPGGDAGMASPNPPPHLLGRVDFRLLKALIEGEQAHPGDACLGPQPVPTDIPAEERGEYPPTATMRCGECGACRRYLKATVTPVATEIERYRHGRRLQLADTWTQLPDWLKAICIKPREERMKALLGDWKRGAKPEGGQFRPAEGVPERYRLTEDEASVYGWEVINGMTFPEIQRELTPKGLRYDRERWKPGWEVERLLESARGKVRGMFGVD